ncbi:MAG TPA: TonB-dependent receptor [Candidatus Acidoferrales bacterium]|nr:TonB-dependent receptor [Candidatus Acidoferrales bacterium]
MPTAPVLSTCASFLKRTVRIAAAVACTLALAISAAAQNASSTKDLANASLEDLMNIQVTSVSRTEQRVSESAAAVFVITHDDIQHSGATNIPDLLRMVPGVQVAQINANKWAISARGLNDLFSNELVVVVDGRRVYTPTFGGVFWDILDLPLEDIQQIEVIRGPGASVWGANAVNGVIDIITKKAADTHGGLITARAGNANGESGVVQCGGALGSATDYRVYTKYFNGEPLVDSSGADPADGWHLLRGGIRVDSSLGAKDKLSIESELYSGREGLVATTFPTIVSPPQSTNVEVNLSGGSIQAAWAHTFSERSDTRVELSEDIYERSDALDERRHTFDFDFQHHFAAGHLNDLLWGGGVRYSDSVTNGNNSISTNPARQNFDLLNAFFQDEIDVVPGLARLTLGSKIERSQYTGFDFLPTARVAFTPTANQTLWAAVSRSVRTPDELDASGRTNEGPAGAIGGVPVIVSVFGNSRIKNETTISYEFGYRTSISRRLTLDVATYYNSYGQQQTNDPAPIFAEGSPAPAHFVLPLLIDNFMAGETHGVELSANWKATHRWTLSSGYAFERIHMHLKSGSTDEASIADSEGSSPVNSGQIRSHLNLPHGLAWDTSVYLVGRLLDPAIPAYTRLDTGLTWQFENNFSVAIYGQNLLQPGHMEFIDADDSVGSSLMKRGGFVKFRWTF